VMQKMVRADFISSVQGSSGGYFLNKSLNELNLFNLIDKIEGPFQLTSCMTHNKKTCNCQQMEACNIKHAVGNIQTEVNHFFCSITLEKFVPHKEDVIVVDV
jgi:Rrf2 family protein